MSGIVGLIPPTGAPVDVPLLRRLTDFLAFRGPDTQEIWCGGHAGLGCAQLCATREAQREQQPCTLDGIRWLVADARLDARAELRHELTERGCSVPADVTDADLILHAHAVWGEECVQHLLGDFAFAIWDEHAGTLFAARDHFGVKPFYYAAADSGLLFGNTLNCLPLHPAVSDRLDEDAVAAFLLFGYNDRPTTTILADVSRLPPAHTLTWHDGVVQLRRYWTLPLDGPVYRGRAEECLEEFATLFHAAVADRLRVDRAALFMSGGLDSTAVAGSAVHGLAQAGRTCDLQAFTTVFERLLPDAERHYADVAAQHLGIPVHYQAQDDYRYYETAHRADLRPPEPLDDLTPAASADLLRHAADHARVALTGQGGDPVLYSAPSYMMGLLTGWRWGHWFRECSGYALSRRRLPPLGLRSWLKRLLRGKPKPPPLPAWILPEFVARRALRQRWADAWTEPPLPATMHAEAHRQLTDPLWPCLFESYDPGATGYPLEVRHPFFDVRLVRFVLTLPVLPWCADKEIVRTIMWGILPEAIRRRRKSPVAGNPVAARLHQGGWRWADHFRPLPALSAYVNVERVRRLAEDADGVTAYTTGLITRPLSLNLWLRDRTRKHPQLLQGVCP